MIRANYIDCPTKAIFNTWVLPQDVNDENGDIKWTTTVYIRDTGELWMYGKLWGGSYSELTDNSVVLSIGGVKQTLSLDGHTQPYTSLTGSTEIANLAILSTGILNLWALKTLGKNAFSDEDYLLADSPAVAVENSLTVKYGKSDATLATYNGDEPVNIKLLEGDNINFILGNQGELIINAEQNSDTTNTTGATNLTGTKLFIIGALELSESPQTYSNSSVFIGTDNLLYSNGKLVATADHNHNGTYLLKRGDTMEGLLSLNDNLQLIANKYIQYNNSPILGYSSSNSAIVIANSSFATKIYSNDSNLIHVKNNTEYTILDSSNFSGILNSTYVNVGGDTMNGMLTIDRSSLDPAIKFNLSGAGKGCYGWRSDTGIYMYSYEVGKYLCIKSDGNAYFGGASSLSKLWHTGNFNPNNYSLATHNHDTRYRILKGTWKASTCPGTREFGFTSNDGNGEVSFSYSSGTLNMSIDGDIYCRDQGYKVWHAGNMGNNSGLDADKLDGFHESDFYRSAITTVNGEVSLKNIPANRSGSYQLTHTGWTGAAHILYAGGSNSTLGFLLPGGGNSTVKVISCTDGNANNWKELGTLAFTTSNVANAANSDKLDGVHLNGIFTSFVANGNNTRLTIGGVTKDLTVPYASNADKLNGVHNGSLTAAILASQGLKTAISGTTLGASGVRMYQVYNNGYPSTYGNLLNVGGGGFGELLLGWTVDTSLGRLYYRSKRDVASTSWSSWGAVAYLTDNVASASKLATTRTIWGLNFNGEGNVSGAMSGVTSLSALYANFSRVTDHGIQVATIRGNTISGKQSGQYIHMYDRVHIGSPNGWGSNSAPSNGLSTYGGAWLATNTGNVGIGTTSPSSSYKLQVQGKIHASDSISSSGRITSSRSGVNTVSTLTSLPVTKDVVLANLKSATNLTLASAMTVGDCITIIVNPSASFELPLPTTSGWSSLDGDTLSLNSGKLAEISILCYASGKYSVSCKAAS